MNHITVNELAATADRVVVDVREPGDYAGGHASGALNIPLGELGVRVAEVPGEGSVYLICQSGRRSAEAASILEQHGRSAVNVEGGTAAWIQAGLQTEQ